MTREQLMDGEYRTINDPGVTLAAHRAGAVSRVCAGDGRVRSLPGRAPGAREHELVAMGFAPRRSCPWSTTRPTPRCVLRPGELDDPILVLTCDGVGDGLWRP